MRSGWSVKDGAAVLQVNPSRFEQAVGPAFQKIAKLMKADPRRTLADLQVAMDRLEKPGHGARPDSGSRMG